MCLSCMAWLTMPLVHAGWGLEAAACECNFVFDSLVSLCRIPARPPSCLKRQASICS